MYDIKVIMERILDEFGWEEVQEFHLKRDKLLINVSYRYGFPHMELSYGEIQLKRDFTTYNIKIINEFLSGDIGADRMFELLRETQDVKISCEGFWELYSSLVQCFVRLDDSKIVWFGNLGDTIIFEGNIVKFEDSRGFLCIEEPEVTMSRNNEGNVSHACIDFISAMNKLDDFVRALEVSRINNR